MRTKKPERGCDLAFLFLFYISKRCNCTPNKHLTPLFPGLSRHQWCAPEIDYLLHALIHHASALTPRFGRNMATSRAGYRVCAAQPHAQQGILFGPRIAHKISRFLTGLTNGVNSGALPNVLISLLVCLVRPTKTGFPATTRKFVLGSPSASFRFGFAYATLFVAFFNMLRLPFLFVRIGRFITSGHKFSLP
ncbi:MAG: hypothetical protein V4805_18040 [Pseudomonadota bacterium]